MLDIERIDEMMRERRVTVACVLYQGEDVPAHSLGIFTPEWVDRLYRGVKRNTTRPFRFVCFVDRDYEFTEPIETKKLCMPYRNMFSLLEPFREDLGHVLFMGLDTIITGNIDHLMDYRGGFSMLRDPYFPERTCSGVMLFPYTKQVWEAFTEAHEKHAKEQTMFGYPSDMIFLQTVPHDVLEGPELGIYSYKVHIKNNPELIDKSCIVYFHGKEKPHELSEPWVKRHWGESRIVGFESGLNTPTKVMIEQAEINLSRDLPMFIEGPVNGNKALLVGGGPSLARTLPNLRMQMDFGGVVFSMNGTHDYLIERGIIPDVHVMLDARAENVRFVQSPHKDVTYLIAAQCHPSVFERLKDYSVVMWLSCMDYGEKELWAKFKHKPLIVVGGGATVGLKTMFLAHLFGFRAQHLYGFDSSYENGQNHAYRQELNDKESRIEVRPEGSDRSFVCAPWMAKQAVEFQKMCRLIEAEGSEIYVHGDGLIPYIAQQLKEAA